MSDAPHSNAPHSNAVDDTIAALALPPSYRAIVEEYWRPLAQLIAAQKRPQTAMLIGVNGAQGSGKSTLCYFLEILLEEAGFKTVTLSIDDIYLPKAERKKLADETHPLFVTRGVPGTHSAALGRSIINNLCDGRPATIPIFDKGSDDRRAETRVINGPVDIILFEGWCVGARPQTEEQLSQPVNRLESMEDLDGTWRRTVNEHLGAEYTRLFSMIDLMVMLKVEDFSVVHANRTLQERKLAEKSPHSPNLMNDAEITRFCAHYERLTRHILRDMPKWADIVIPIGPDQSPTSLVNRFANEQDGAAKDTHNSPHKQQNGPVS